MCFLILDLLKKCQGSFNDNKLSGQIVVPHFKNCTLETDSPFEICATAHDRKYIRQNVTAKISDAILFHTHFIPLIPEDKKNPSGFSRSQFQQGISCYNTNSDTK